MVCWVEATFIMVSAICITDVMVQVNSMQCTGGKMVDGICFVIYRMSKTWSEAREECHSRGMILASFNTSGQAIRVIPDPKAYIWVGAHRKTSDEDSPVMWSDIGQVVPYTFVADIIENQMCGMLTHFHMIRIDSCNKTLNFMCMAKTVVFAVPELLQCHCMDDSCMDDKCTGQLQKCRRNFFGPYCQYRNLAADIQVEELADDDKVTCLRSELGQMDLRIKFNTPEVFTWANISYRVRTPSQRPSRGYMMMITWADDEKHCGWRFHHFYPCPVDRLVDSILFILETSAPLCDLKIFGGRNVAFMQLATASSKVFGDPAALVDGQRMMLGGCFKTPSADKSHFVEVILDKVYFVYTVHVYGSPVSEFTLSCFDDDDTMLPYCHLKRTLARNRVYFGMIPGVTMRKIRVSMINLKQNSAMEVCEIEAYGDCIPPYTGVFCNSTCDDSCAKSSCSLSGDCFDMEPLNISSLSTILPPTSKSTTAPNVSTLSTRRWLVIFAILALITTCGIFIGSQLLSVSDTNKTKSAVDAIENDDAGEDVDSVQEINSTYL